MIRCAIFGHKKKLHTGGGTQSEEATVTMGNMTLHAPWCYRCQRYIIPPFSITMLINFFPTSP